MILYFKFLISKHKLILTYSVIGIISILIDMLIYKFCFSILKFNYFTSNFISVHFGILNSFLLNRNFNFKIKNRPANRLLIFYLVGCIGIGVSSLILFISVDLLRYSAINSKLVAILIVALFQFFLNSRITFKIDQNE